MTDVMKMFNVDVDSIDYLNDNNGLGVDDDCDKMLLWKTPS